MFKDILKFFSQLFKPVRLTNPECCYDCADRCVFPCILNRDTCDNHKCISGSCGCYVKIKNE